MSSWRIVGISRGLELLGLERWLFGIGLLSRDGSGRRCTAGNGCLNGRSLTFPWGEAVFASLRAGISCLLRYWRISVGDMLTIAMEVEGHLTHGRYRTN